MSGVSCLEAVVVRHNSWPSALVGGICHTHTHTHGREDTIKANTVLAGYPEGMGLT